MDEIKPYSDMVNIFREQRHDFLNHIQVILGYLQLNKADRAVTYIKKVNEEMLEFSPVTKLENPFLVMTLIQVYQKSKSFGIKLSFQFGNNITLYRNYDESVTNLLGAVLDRYIEFVGAMGKEEQSMQLSLSEIDHNICWEISASFFEYEELVRELKNQLNEFVDIKGNIQVKKLAEQIRIFFTLPRNN